MLLPGPEAQQLAIYIGWLLHRMAGGLVAGILFVLPGAAAIMGLSIVYALYGAVAGVQALFFGLKAAVLAIVLDAVMRIGRRSLRNGLMVGLAASAFVGIFFLHLPFPAIVLGAGLIGFAGGRAGLPQFAASGHKGADGSLSDADSALGETLPAHARPSLGHSLRIAAICLVLWLAPVVGLWLALGGDNTFVQIALFFSKMAVVSFGGAYAVLAYVAQAAVETYRLAAPGRNARRLGMAETTPGPLIMVVQFVGFMAGFRNPGALGPLCAGALAGLLTSWVTFVPCFLWIFLGAPFVETLRANRALGGALAAITAAVVGVILNLALWFALHTLFATLGERRIGWVHLPIPSIGGLNWTALALTLAAGIAIFRFKIGTIPVCRRRACRHRIEDPGRSRLSAGLGIVQRVELFGRVDRAVVGEEARKEREVARLEGPGAEERVARRTNSPA